LLNNIDIAMFPSDFFMNEALKEAQKAFDKDEIPIGAVVVCNNTVIARAHNLTETLNDVTAHAEMQAITSAAEYLGGKYLNQCTLYVTVEPCPMCAGALYWAQLAELVFSASDAKRGFSVVTPNVLHPKTQVISGVLSEKSSQLMKDFFEKKRK
jgi:tRNA(adenine34) deaminase